MFIINLFTCLSQIFVCLIKYSLFTISNYYYYYYYYSYQQQQQHKYHECSNRIENTCKIPTPANMANISPPYLARIWEIWRLISD